MAQICNQIKYKRYIAVSNFPIPLAGPVIGSIYFREERVPLSARIAEQYSKRKHTTTTDSGDIYRILYKWISQLYDFS
jgi:hypothetical protein